MSFITKVADRATTITNTANTIHDWTATGLTVGNVMIVRSAADNTGGGGAARSVVLSGSGFDAGNIWYLQHNYDPAGASAGVTVNLIWAAITGTTVSGRLTYSGSVTQVLVCEEWSGIAITTTSSVVETGANSTNLSSPTTGVNTPAGNLLYTAIAVEGPGSDTFTGDSADGWTSLTPAGTSTGVAATECTVYGGYKVTSVTGAQTFDSTVSTARDSSAICLELGPTGVLRVNACRTNEAVRRASTW
jgi:hypothetical protein